MILDEEETANLLLNITDHDPYSYTLREMGDLRHNVANRVLDHKPMIFKSWGRAFSSMICARSRSIARSQSPENLLPTKCAR